MYAQYSIMAVTCHLLWTGKLKMCIYVDPEEIEIVNSFHTCVADVYR